MIKILRHGDLGLVPIEQLPKEIKTKASGSKVIMKGSGGNDHKIDKGLIYFCNHGKFDIGFLVAKDTTLMHPDHGTKCAKDVMRKAKLDDGVYGLIRQKEETNTGMKSVID